MSSWKGWRLPPSYMVNIGSGKHNWPCWGFQWMEGDFSSLTGQAWSRPSISAAGLYQSRAVRKIHPDRVRRVLGPTLSGKGHAPLHVQVPDGQLVSGLQHCSDSRACSAADPLGGCLWVISIVFSCQAAGGYTKEGWTDTYYVGENIVLSERSQTHRPHGV